MKPKAKQKLPKGWDDARVKRLLNHYEQQSPDDATKEDDARFAETTTTVAVPVRLLPKVRRLLASYRKSA